MSQLSQTAAAAVIGAVVAVIVGGVVVVVEMHTAFVTVAVLVMELMCGKIAAVVVVGVWK